MIRFWRILLVLFCLDASARADDVFVFGELSGQPSDGVFLFPSSFERVTGVLRDSVRPAKQSFTLALAPKILELRASYWGKRRAESVSIDPDQSPSMLQGGYYNMLARTSPWDGRLVGEGEVAYSALGVSPPLSATPLMTRFGMVGNWNKAGYGLVFRSLGRGFVPLAGATIEHDRDESQIWGEYTFDLFRLRAMADEVSQVDSVSRQMTVTRSATAAFQVNRAAWSLLFSSNYAAIGRSEPAAARSFAFSNRLAAVYRPVQMFTFEPAVQLSREWEPASGTRTETPSAGFTLAYSPLQELQLLGRASVSRRLREDLPQDASSLHTGAGVNWSLGKSIFGDRSISLHVDYKNDSGSSLSNEEAHLSAMIQFKLAGF